MLFDSCINKVSILKPKKIIKYQLIHKTIPCMYSCVFPRMFYADAPNANFMLFNCLLKSPFLKKLNSAGKLLPVIFLPPQFCKI